MAPMTSLETRPSPYGSAAQPPAGSGPGGRQGPAGPPPPRRRRNGPIIATAAAATALMTAAAVGLGTVVVRSADDVVAAFGDAPAAVTQQVAPQPDGPAADATLDGTVDWGEVAAAVQPSVVAITVQAADGSGGEGSGVVLDGEGHVLTNNHVVAAAADGGQARVTLFDGRVLEATVVGLDPSTDLAVLQLADPPADLVPAQLGSSADVQVGDPVMAVGNPLGLSGTVTTGIVSALDRPVTTQGAGVGGGEPVVTDAVQTDAAVNPGNSGGALVDAQGRVVGINSSIATLGGAGSASGSIGLGFAIPVDVASSVADQLVADGTADHPRLGVYLEDATADVADGDWAGTRLGAGVTDIVPDSPAQAAGLRAGDVVVAVDGRPTTGAEALTARVRALQPDDTVTLVVERDGQAQQVEVTLSAAEG